MSHFMDLDGLSNILIHVWAFIFVAFAAGFAAGWLSGGRDG